MGGRGIAVVGVAGRLGLFSWLAQGKEGCGPVGGNGFQWLLWVFLIVRIVYLLFRLSCSNYVRH